MEILYSSAIFAFLRKAKSLAKTILSKEMGLRVGQTRFFVKNTSYPLHLVAFQHPSKLGYFQADLYELGINKVFLFENDEKLRDVLRHELAHYLTYIEFGAQVSHHGKEFHEICKRYGWSPEVSRAQIQFEKITQNEKILEKIQKLLSLATSHHPNEAEAATLKAHELLLKYNLDLQKYDDEMYLRRILPQKRNSAKLQAISSILHTFFVHPVFNHGKDGVYLEILGKKIDVEVAEYVAYFLNQRFETLWKQAKIENFQLKGISSKNSFFRGLAEGYLKKIKPPSSSLILLEKQLIETASQVYPHLKSSRTFFKHEKLAAKMGEEAGRNLSINQGIQKSDSLKTYNLTHIK